MYVQWKIASEFLYSFCPKLFTRKNFYSTFYFHAGKPFINNFIAYNLILTCYFEKFSSMKIKLQAEKKNFILYHFNSSFYYKESIVLSLYNACNRLRDSYNS